MKYTGLYLAILIAMSVSSCKKDSDNIPLGSILVTVDGNKTKFSNSAKATVLPVQGGYGIKIEGLGGILSNKLEISIVSPQPIVARNYTETSSGNPLVKMNYSVSQLIFFYEVHSSFNSASNPVSVTIDEITSSRVRGSFRGMVTYTNTSTGVTVNNQFEEGVFNLSF